MQPTDVPENCEFIVGDLTETLADFDTGSFDLVHSRYPHYPPDLLAPLHPLFPFPLSLYAVDPDSFNPV
jgi:hypothetical protein